MKNLGAALDKVLEEALDAALAALREKATSIVVGTLERSLEVRLKALLDGGGSAPTPEAPARVKAKAAKAVGVTPKEEEEANPPVKVRRRKKEDTPKPEEDLAAILEAAKVALAKFGGVTTPRGKPLPEVLHRRLKKTLEHAKALGKSDLRLLAQRAMAIIDIDPMAAAMGSWQALAARLGLPVPLSQA